MKNVLATPLFLLVCWVASSNAASLDTINGSVKDSTTNTPIDSVTASSEGISTRTNASGVFKLIIPGTAVVRSAPRTISWDPECRFLSWRGNMGGFSLEIRNLSGTLQALCKSNGATGRLSIARLSQGIYVATIRSSSSVDAFKIMKVKTGASFKNLIVSRISGPGNFMLSKASGTTHVVVFSKAGYAPDTVNVPMNALGSAQITVKMLKSYTVLFDGTNLDNWEHDSHFTIQDSAITGTGCWCMAFTKKDYGKYRFFATARVKSPTVGPDRNGTGVMLGIEIWGKRHTGDYSPNGTIHIMPPLMWSWDYLHNTQVKYTATVEKDPGFPMNAWNKLEILSDVAKGKFRMAVNGVEVLGFTATVPSDWSVGPIGVLDHNGGSVVVQYKDIKIEEDPTNFELITLKP